MLWGIKTLLVRYLLFCDRHTGSVAEKPFWLQSWVVIVLMRPASMSISTLTKELIRLDNSMDIAVASFLRMNEVFTYYELWRNEK